MIRNGHVILGLTNLESKANAEKPAAAVPRPSSPVTTVMVSLVLPRPSTELMLTTRFIIVNQLQETPYS